MGDSGYLNVEKSKSKWAFVITVQRIDGLSTTTKGGVRMAWKRGNLSGETKVTTVVFQSCDSALRYFLQSIFAILSASTGARSPKWPSHLVYNISLFCFFFS